MSKHLDSPDREKHPLQPPTSVCGTSNAVDNAKQVAHIFGTLLLFVGFVLLLPLIVIPFYLHEVVHIFAFVIPAVLVFAVGISLRSIRPEQERRLTAQQDALIVTGIWVLSPLFSALPFVISQQLNFTQGYFEAMSAWTTTGLSVMDVTKTPQVFLLYRSIMQFFGGVGLILVVVSALSETYGLKLYTAEGHSDKLLPNLARSARLILKIYTVYFVSGTVLYVCFGMPLFDAVNHSMAALSTGGFSVMSDSIGAYNNVYIEAVTIVLMILGTTSFFAHMLLIKRKFRSFFRLGEMRFMALLIGLTIPLVAVVSLIGLYGSVSMGFRVALFNVISALTTTGFASVSYENWPDFAVFIMVILMTIGGGLGSTAGGVKAGRIYLMFRIFLWNIKKRFMPERSRNELSIFIPQGKTFVDDKMYAFAANYVFIYLVTIALGTLVLAALGYSLRDSLFEFSSAAGTAGLSIGVTSATMHPVAFWTLVVGMLLGRLEIYVVFIAIVKCGKSFSSHVLRRKK